MSAQRPAPGTLPTRMLIVKRAAGGQSTTFEFRADLAGTFTFYCNLTKDPGCAEMKGTLVVKPK